MASSEKEHNDMSAMKLQLPISLLRKTCGLALDMGGSVLKIVYMDKKDWKCVNMDSSTETLGPVRFISFSVNNLEDAMTFLKVNVYVLRSRDEKPIVFTSGIGLQKIGKMVEETLDVRVQNTLETECFIRGLQYCLQHVPEATLVGAPHTAGVKRGVERARAVINHARKHGTKPDNTDKVWDGLEKVTSHLDSILERVPETTPLGVRINYPILLGLFGSGFAFMKVQEDGSYNMNAMSPIGGRTLLSLGGLLSGAKTYEGVMELVEKGNGRNLDVYLNDMLSSSGKQDRYSSASTMDLLIYQLGKANDKNLDDFSREDLAAAVHHLVAHNCINMVTTMLPPLGCSDFIVTGGFASHPLTKELFADEFYFLSAKKAVFERNLFLPKIHQLSIGGHLGALGALLHSCGL